MKSKKYNSLVIKGNIEKNINHHVKNYNSFPVSSLNMLLKKENEVEYVLNKSTENKKKLKTNSKRPIHIPPNKGNLTLEKEENNIYCPYFCFKNYE